MKNKTLITAHNGADGRPEDSMEYVLYALSTDADVMEIDIRRMPDGTLVFTHDIPTPDMRLVLIEDIFHRVHGTGKLVNCDLKHAGLEADVYALAKECGIERQLIYSGTVSAAYCQETGLNHRVRIALNIEEYVPDLYARCRQDPAQTIEAAQEISAVCRRYGIECVNANYHLAGDAFLDVLDSNGLTLSAWTVDDLKETSRFLRRGIENVTTRNLQETLALKYGKTEKV